MCTVCATCLCVCVSPPRTGWLSYYKIFKMPVLVALHPADTAKALAAKTDKEVVDEAIKVGGWRMCVCKERGEDGQVVQRGCC